MAENPRAIVFNPDPGIRDLFQLLLELEGFQVNVFPEPDACLLYFGSREACRVGPPFADLMVIGYRLPRMSGLDFVRRQWDLGCRRLVPHRAVISAVWSQEDLAEAERLGCRAIPKPFSSREICLWFREIKKSLDPCRLLSDKFGCS
jgi:CheY-like chemotaxis protein